MNKKSSRRKLAVWIGQNRSKLVRSWSDQIFKVPGHRRLKDIISTKTHQDGMNKFLQAFQADIAHPGKNLCDRILNNLVFKGFLSVNTAEDTIHGLIILRGMIADELACRYKTDIRDLVAIVDTEINKDILCLSKIYRKRDFKRLQTIMKYGKRLIAVYNLDKLCQLILEAAIKESGSDRGSIMLLGRDGKLYIKSSVGIPRKIVSSTSQKYGKGIAGKVIKTSTPIIINEGHKIPRGIGSSLRGLGLASAVSIPISSHERVLGVLNLGKRHKKPLFDEEDVELLHILAYEAGAAINNCQLFEELQDLYIGSVIALASAIDARDHYTHGHSKRVAKFAVAIAKELKLSNEAVDRVHFAGLLHDIGKIGIPDRILLKPGKLTKAEHAIIKKHPIFAVEILKHLPRLQSLIPIVYHEHERYDGKGYVAGLKGKAIPLESRIIAVADAYEAMVSHRPYRKALPKRSALIELKRCSGSQFDPTVVRAFLRII